MLYIGPHACTCSLYWLHVAGIIHVDAQIMNGWNMVYTAICLKSKRVEVIENIAVYCREEGCSAT